MVLAGATADTIALIVIFFVVFPVLAQGLIAYAIAQAAGEKRENEDYKTRAGQQPSRG